MKEKSPITVKQYKICPKTRSSRTRQSELGLLLKLCLLQSSFCTYKIMRNSYIHNRAGICDSLVMNEIYTGNINHNRKISININPSDPNKIELLPDANNIKMYQVIARGTECYTWPNPARFNTFGFIMEPVPDAEPDNPLTSFTCRIRTFILPTDMIPCDPAVTYIKFEESFRFYFNSVYMTFDEIKRNSRVNYSYTHYRYYYIIRIGMDVNLPFSAYFSDNFIEMLLAQPFHVRASSYVTLFSKAKLVDYNTALSPHSLALTPPEYLRRITHDSLPGYYFVPDPSGDNGRFAHLMGISYLRMTITYSFTLYMSEPQNMDASNVGVLRYRLDHRYNDMHLVRVNYQFHIMKVGSDVRIEMRRIDLADDTTVNGTISINIPLTKTDEYVHFGFAYGIAHLYYKTGTTMLIRVYETLFGWHDGNKQITSGQYDIEGTYQSLLRGGNAELSDFQYSNYNDRAMTTQNSQNIFGLRLFCYSGEYGAYPATKIPKSEPNLNYDGQCMYFGIFKHSCNAYAFQRKATDLNGHYIYYGQYRGRTSYNPSSKCLAPFRYAECLVPYPSYNRDLVFNSRITNYMKMHLFSDFEGDSQQAIDLRANRAKFTDNLNKEYWVLCPEDCKNPLMKFWNLLVLISFFRVHQN